MRPNSLESIEKKVFQLSTDHGGWDLYPGLLLAAIGVSALLEDLNQGDSSWWLAGIMAVAIVLFYFVRQWIVRPRLGMVRFGTRQQANLKTIGAIIGAALLVGVLVWILFTGVTHTPRWTTLLPILIWVTLSLAGFGLAAYLLGIPQLYVYGLLYAAGFASLELIPSPVTRTFPSLGFGLAIMAVGAVRFVRFLRKYPPMEEMHE